MEQGLFMHRLSSSHEGHGAADLALVGGSGVDHAGNLTAAQNDNPVAELQQNVEVFADVHDGDALHLLLGEQVVNGVGRVDIESAHRVSRHENGRRLRNFTTDQNLLHVAAGHAAHGEVRAGRHNAELVPDAVCKRLGVLAV